MGWFRRKAQTPTTSSSGENASDAEYEAAANASVETAQEDIRAAVAEAQEEGEDARPELPIDSDFADEAARLCFAPLAKYDHPAWDLDDAEAAKLAPRFERFFQAVSHRYLPAVMLRMAARHPEMFNLSVVLLLMYWKKYRIVSKAKRVEAEREADRSIAAATGAVPFARPANPDEYMEAEAAGERPEFSSSLKCEVCGNSFLSVAAMSAHLPCRGRAS